MSVTLLPSGGLIRNNAVVQSEAVTPSLTYRIDWWDGTNIVGGHVDGLAAVRQAVFKYLQTWRNHYPIYDGQYGIEISDLTGRETGYAQALLPGRIRDALSVDDRIISADGFVFNEAGRDGLECVFTVHTVYGDVEGQVNV